MKDLRAGLFADRCPSNLFDSNALRLRLLKLGARVRLSVRRIHFALSGACPDRDSLRRSLDESRPRLTVRREASGQTASGRSAEGEAAAFSRRRPAPGGG